MDSKGNSTVSLLLIMKEISLKSQIIIVTIDNFFLAIDTAGHLQCREI